MIVSYTSALAQMSVLKKLQLSYAIEKDNSFLKKLQLSYAIEKDNSFQSTLIGTRKK